MSPAKSPTPQNRKDLRPQPVSDPLHVVYWRFGASEDNFFACCNQIISIFDYLVFLFQGTRNLKDSVYTVAASRFRQPKQIVAPLFLDALVVERQKFPVTPHPKFH